jgi:phosphoribosylformylglycinamidine cyclo-ligase
MCADDVVCAGAQPLFFLDYVVVGRLDPAKVAAIVDGIAGGCDLAGCGLIGGETAEHPSLMEPDEFDLAGFCVGLVERERLLDGSAVRAGDAVIGIASSGLHANGYSLVRALIERFQLQLSSPYLECVRLALGEDGARRLQSDEPDLLLATLGEVLLTPTRIYAPDVLALRTRLDEAGSPLAALSHVTGGGLARNVPRVLPSTLGARIVTDAWPLPSVFALLSALAGMDGAEMRATLNGGIGMVAIVPPAGVATALASLTGRGLRAWRIGEVMPVDALDGARYVEVPS